VLQNYTKDNISILLKENIFPYRANLYNVEVVTLKDLYIIKNN